MPDESVTTTIEPTTPPEPTPDPLDAETARATKAAGEFLERQQTHEQPKPERLRGADGKFLPKEKGEIAPAEPASPVKLDGAWVEAAKTVGFSDDQIAQFKSDQDLQKEVAWRRQSVLQSTGIDPNELEAFRQWRQSQQQSPLFSHQSYGQPPEQGAFGPQYNQNMYSPQALPPLRQQAPLQNAPQNPPAIPALKLDLGEDKIAPEYAGPLRSIEQTINQQAAANAVIAAENQQLRQMMAGLYGMVQQSAEQARAAAQMQQQAAEWDAAVKEIPGFVEAMGLPSDVMRKAQQNPYDPQVQNYAAFRAYFDPTAQRYAAVLGPQIPLGRVVADAFSASPFARTIGASGRNNGTNGKNGPQPGSVVRGDQRRGPSAESPPKGDPMVAEIERINEFVASSWGQAGGNPMRE